MTNDKMIRFVKRWQALEQQRKDYEFTRATFAKDLRDEFSTDASFTKWCADELGLTSGQADELLAHARAARSVTDAKTWERLGGFKQIRMLDSLGGNRRSRVEVIEAAKSTGKRIQSIIRERAPKNDSTPRAPTAYEDAESLARFILTNCRDMPAAIRSIVSRYVTAARRAA